VIPSKKIPIFSETSVSAADGDRSIGEKEKKKDKANIVAHNLVFMVLPPF
jgi:hypothetical protein